MPEIAPASLIEQLRWRYATKEFDTTRKIPDDVWGALEESLILTPSSYGLQPWRFVVITGQETKDQLVPFSWRQKQPAQCSHFVVFAVNRALAESDVDNYLARIVDVRGVTPESLAGFRKMLTGAIVQGMSEGARMEWAIRQAYIALGNFMTAAAVLGIDTCPMEGIDPVRYDEVLELEALGYTTCVACAAGYRSATDRYATVPKVRYLADQIILRK